MRYKKIINEQKFNWYCTLCSHDSIFSVDKAKVTNFERANGADVGFNNVIDARGVCLYKHVVSVFHNL